MPIGEVIFKRASLFILFTTAAWAAVCFFKVHQALDPSGGDGYFYLKQIEWLVNHRQFYHADYSFVFFPLAVIYALTGSSLLAFQIVTSISLFLISSSIGLLFYKSLETTEQPWPVWRKISLSCFFTLALAMQGSTLKLSYEFAKNGFAQGLLLFGILLYFTHWRRLSFVLFVLAALTHKIVLVFFVFASGFLAWNKLKTYRREKSFKFTFIFAGFAGVFVFALVAATVFFPRLVKHLQSFVDHFSFEKRFMFQVENLLLSRFLIGLCLIWLMVGFVQYRKKKNAILLAMLVFSVAPFFPFFAGHNIEIKYRLLLMSFTFSAVAFVWTWPTIKNQYLRRLLMMITLTILSFQSLQNTGFPWIVNWSERVQNLDQLQAKVSPQDELVTQHGLQFYIDYKTPIRARSMVSSQRKPKYQVAYTPEFYHLNPQLSDEIRKIEVLSLGGNYALFEYEEFQNLIKDFPMLSDWRNVFQVRPEFVQDY